MDISQVESLRQTLKKGIEELHLTLDAPTLDGLLSYILEFQRWNKTHNLSAIHSLEESIALHLLDSLAVLPYLDDYAQENFSGEVGFSIADLGTGGGLPGLVIAICRPSWRVYLMEAVQKKTVFLEHIVMRQHLKNVVVCSGRIEDTSKPLGKSVTCCISRAFSDFGKFITLSAPMLMDGGVVWAMKAKLLDDDLKTIPENWEIKANHSLYIPGLDAQRRLLRLAAVRESHS